LGFTGWGSGFWVEGSGKEGKRERVDLPDSSAAVGETSGLKEGMPLWKVEPAPLSSAPAPCKSPTKNFARDSCAV